MMSWVKHSLIAGAVTGALLTAAPAAEAQNSLTAARELYALAEYGHALTMLESLLVEGDRPRAVRQSIELYRTLCLVALNRKAEAERAIERILAEDPLYRPAADDIPPRMRSAFGEVRKRVLPSLIQQKYLDAKAAYDRQDLTAAANGFAQVVEALADPDIAEAASRPPL